VQRHFLGPIRWSSRARSGAPEGDGDGSWSVTSTPCRARSAAAGCTPTRSSPLPRGGLPPPPALGPMDDADRGRLAARSTPTSSRTNAESERAIGVAGEETNPFAAWRSGPYPMPPGPDMFGATLTIRLPDRAAPVPGLPPAQLPALRRTAGLQQCGFCGCTSPDRGEGDPVAMLRRALRTGRCEVRPESLVTTCCSTAPAPRPRRALPRPRPRAPRGARTVRRGSPPARSRRPGSCCSNELANSSGLVGRNLMFTSRRCRSARSVPACTACAAARSPAPTTTTSWRRARPRARSAGLPWLAGRWSEHGGRRPAGAGSLVYGAGAHHGASMRDSSLRERLWSVHDAGRGRGPALERIDLDPTIRDAWGFPAGRVTYAPHLTSSPPWTTWLRPGGRALPGRRRVDHHVELTAARRRRRPHPLGIRAGQLPHHGTCRMGDDRRPASSTRTALLGRAQRGLRRLVGLRHVGRLQPTLTIAGCITHRPPLATSPPAPRPLRPPPFFAQIPRPRPIPRRTEPETRPSFFAPIPPHRRFPTKNASARREADRHPAAPGTRALLLRPSPQVPQPRSSAHDHRYPVAPGVAVFWLRLLKAVAARSISRGPGTPARSNQPDA